MFNLLTFVGKKNFEAVLGSERFAHARC